MACAGQEVGRLEVCTRIPEPVLCCCHTLTWIFCRLEDLFWVRRLGADVQGKLQQAAAGTGLFEAAAKLAAATGSGAAYHAAQAHGKADA